MSRLVRALDLLPSVALNIFQRIGAYSAVVVNRRQESEVNSALSQVSSDHREVCNVLLRLKNSMGFCPLEILDIGAHQGHFAREVARVYPDSSYVLVEPLRHQEQMLLDHMSEHGIRAQSFCELLWSDSRDVDFYEMENGSSVLPEQSGIDRSVSTRRTTTLDQLCAKNSLTPDFIKIDTQGAEYQILKGGSSTIERASLLLVEVSLIKTNKGCENFIKICAYLNDFDFEIIEIVNQNRRKDGHLWQVDVFFMKSAQASLINPRLCDATW